MNISKQLQCDTCEVTIDCRIGMSNRDVQPFQFACPECEESIKFTIGNDNPNLTGASEVDDRVNLFTGKNPFVDLHLDFPVSFGSYKKGDTAFMRAISTIGEEAFGDLNYRLEILNNIYPKQRQLKRLVTQFKRRDITALEKVVKDIGIEQISLKSHLQQDVIAAMYSATSIMSAPFTIHQHNSEISKEAPKLLHSLHYEYKRNFELFFEKILQNNFLINLYSECLTLYPEMLKIELPIRPALYFDYVDSTKETKIPVRVSTAAFEDCNNFYKDLSEVFSRQLILIAAINNLFHRGDFDLFDESVRLNNKGTLIRDFSSLDCFANVDLGRKLSAIDNSFYNIDACSLDNKLRNAIAHYKYEYTESSQIIKYFSKKEGMVRETYHEISFIDFTQKILQLFREIHSINHIIKAILYYVIFGLKKDLNITNE